MLASDNAIDQLATARSELLRAVFGGVDTPTLSTKHFLAFAEAKCDKLDTLLQKAIPRLCKQPNNTHSRSPHLAYVQRHQRKVQQLRLLARVADALRDESSSRSIDDMIESIVTGGTSTTEQWALEDWTISRHTCIACVGIVSMLWNVDCSASDPMRLARKSISLEDACRKSIDTFHRDACGTLPEVVVSGIGSLKDTQIYAAAISYWSLWKFAGIKIEWTEDFSMHLFFEPRRRLLYLFGYPSYAALSCKDNEDSLNDM